MKFLRCIFYVDSVRVLQLEFLSESRVLHRKKRVEAKYSRP